MRQKLCFSYQKIMHIHLKLCLFLKPGIWISYWLNTDISQKQQVQCKMNNCLMKKCIKIYDVSHLHFLQFCFKMFKVNFQLSWTIFRLDLFRCVQPSDWYKLYHAFLFDNLGEHFSHLIPLKAVLINVSQFLSNTSIALNTA